MEDNERMEETLDRGEEKTFTQEEVEEIVKKRLARERKKAARGTEGEDSLTERENRLAEREIRLTARERLQEEGLPMSLADVLRYSDEKTLETAIEALKEFKADTEPRKSWGMRQSSSGKNTGDSQIRQAMGLNQK